MTGAERAWMKKNKLLPPKGFHWEMRGVVKRKVGMGGAIHESWSSEPVLVKNVEKKNGD